MNVNLLDLKAQNGALEPELEEAFLRVLRSGHFILGPEVERWQAYAVARVIATRGKSFHEGITDHLIANYIRGLKGEVRRTAAARRKLTSSKIA